MSNATRIHRRHPSNPAREVTARLRHRPGITVFRGTTTAGRHYYHDGDDVPASLPYVCAVVRKPYRGNSATMRRGDDRTVVTP